MGHNAFFLIYELLTAFFNRLSTTATHIVKPSATANPSHPPTPSPSPTHPPTPSPVIPNLSVSPYSLNTSNCSLGGNNTYSCHVTLGEEQSATVNWSVSDDYGLGVTFSPSSGMLSSSGSPQYITISNIPCQHDTFTFSGSGANRTTATWNCSQPPPTYTPTPSPQWINNDDPGISYPGSCGYNHGLSSALYNDDVEICTQQNDSFTYTFTGISIYLVTVYYQNHGGTISCYIDGSFTQSFNLDSSVGVDSSGLAYGIQEPIAPKLAYRQHTASCTMTSASGTYFFVDALIINQ